MRTFGIAVALAALIPALGLAQTPYSQDFEGLAPVNGSLSGDGWLNYGNVFTPGGAYIYGYGPFGAVNNIGNWQDIVAGEGGPAQGTQQLVVYSDYANGNHGVGNLVESNLYREWTIGAGASGVWVFTFDAKMGNLGGSSTAIGFIKTLDPNAGWAMTNFITADMTTTPITWTGYTLSIDVAGLDGQILQIGFSTTATNYEPCGVFYDNVNFAPEGSTSTEAASWGGVKSLFR
ncbi:MAG: hypothetical protein EHM19_06145 [Candidatus Latescibacterota bacterium]|nr:MAG: hypothetical protein EHM19_06145 [Candidatus Latescibacterota bacterium]